MTKTAEIAFHSVEDGLNKMTFDIGEDNLLTIQEGKKTKKNTGYITKIKNGEIKEQQDLDSAEITKHTSGISNVIIAEHFAKSLSPKKQQKTLMTGIQLLFPKKHSK